MYQHQFHTVESLAHSDSTQWCALNLGHFDLQYDKEQELYYIQGVNKIGSVE